MIEKEIEEFKKYVSNYDLNNEGIFVKFNHTLRVVDYADKITADEKDSDLRRLSLIGALLHDISRFKQWTEYNTYEDAKSFDHGDMSYEIIKQDDYINKYVQDEDEKEIIFNAVKKHNKKCLELTGDYKTDYVAKVVKDADKLDIINTQYNDEEENCYIFKTYSNLDEFEINEKVIESILNKELCNNKDTVSYFDEIVRELAFIFDVNFKNSFKIISDKDFVNRKIQILRKHDNNKKYEDIINKIEKTLKEFIDEKLKED